VVDEMKVARGARVNGRLFQLVLRAGGVCSAQFASAKIVLSILFGLFFLRHHPFPCMQKKRF
jgi:hypothetical protein